MNIQVRDRSLRIKESTIIWGGILIGIESFLLLSYFSFTDSRITTIRHVLYPFIWINVSIWAVVRTQTPDVETKYRAVAGVVAVVYFLILMYLSSLIGTVPGASISLNVLSASLPTLSLSAPTFALTILAEPLLHVGHVVDTGWQVSWVSPGWGPIISYNNYTFYFELIPFQVIGYAALSYLVYDALLDTTKSVFAGAFGFVSCVGCTWPIAASLITGVLGGSSLAVGTGIYNWSYGIGTVVFVAAVFLLYWRPYS
ncbi:MAG: hypothetical protein SXQ77_02130 [Halobacteria archaeon]|nr:hypothetical protein [Halobacteria archaeon]